MKWFFSLFFSASFIFLAVFGMNCVYGYLFPMKYREEIINACEIFDVDEALVFSVINVESRFDQNAVSHRGAVGLMQIMPSTAEWLAGELNIDQYDLKKPEDNIIFGVYYLSELCQRFEKLETALAAYNAGPTNVSNWLKKEEYSSDGTTLKQIPFEETRNYIQKFQKNYRYYKKKA